MMENLLLGGLLQSRKFPTWIILNIRPGLIHQYLTELVQLSYPADDDVMKDEKHQNFFQEVVDNGFRRFENGADQDSQITMELILDSLPLLEITFYMLNVSNLMGTFSPIERFYLGDVGQNKLGMLGENMAVSPEQEACIRRMGERMRELKDKIDARNKGRRMNYDVLSPINTPITTQA
ncbi:hypothetical protein ACHWQZ_G003340 [Mnemiopsis leidyi]